MRKFTQWILTFLVFSVLLTGFFHPITSFSQDLGRHLLLGKLIIQTQHVPEVNLLSYTYPAYPFLNHHYLSEVIFYLLYQTTGAGGLLITMTLIVILAFGLVYFYSLKKVHPIPLSLVTLLYLPVLFERTDIRPEMFSFLLLSIFMVLLYKYKESGGKWILWLVPLELLWVQLHISFIIGLIIIGLFLIDNLMTNRKNLFNSTTTTLILTLLGATLITIFNPNGISGALYPVRIFQNYGYMIEENQNIFFLENLFNKPTIPFFKLSVLLLFLSLLSSLKHTKPIDWMLAFVFTFLGGNAVRSFPLFVFATFIPAATYFSRLFHTVKTIYSPPRAAISYLYGLFIFFILVLGTRQVINSTQTNGFGLGTTQGAEKAGDFYLSQHLRGPVFNNFDIGSYLAYRIYPNGRVFIDGRPEAYPASFFQSIYIPMQENPNLFVKLSRLYRFNTIFFAHTDQTPWAKTFLQSITKDRSWIPVYLDHTVLILVKNNSVNMPIIKTFGMQETNTRAQNTTGYSKRELLQLLNFYLLVDNRKQAELTASQLVKRVNCQALPRIFSATLDLTCP